MIRKKRKEKIENPPKIYGNESFGIPADCTKKQRFSTLKLSVYLVVVVLLCGCVYGGYQFASDYFIPDMTYDKSDFPMLYVKDTTLTVKLEDARKGISVTRAAQYAGSDAAAMTKLTADGKILFYGAESQGSAGFDLYCRPTEKEGESRLIDRGVTRFSISADGKQVAYLKDARLYLSVNQQAALVAVDVTDYAISENNQQLIYQKENGSKLYTCSIGPSPKPVLVDQGIQRLLTPLSEYGEIYYLKNDALFCKRYGEQALCLVTDVKDAAMLDDFLYLVKTEVRAIPFSQLFEDTHALTDSTAAPPKRTDFLVPNAAGTLVLDSHAYQAAMAEFDAADRRSALREQLKSDPINAPANILYTLKRGELYELDSGLTNAPLTTQYSCTSALAYEKQLPPDKKLELSDFSTVEEAQTAAISSLFAEKKAGLCLLLQDKTPYLALEYVPDGQMEISYDRNFLYAIEQTDETGRGTLMRYTIGNRGLRNAVVLKEGVTDFAIDSADSSVVMVFDGNRLGICKGQTYTHLSDRSTRSYFYVDGTLFFYDDYSEETKVGVLKTYRDGRVRLVDIGVYDFDVHNLKTVAYIKNYDRSAGFGDLYLKSGSARGKRLDVCVRQILCETPLP